MRGFKSRKQQVKFSKGKTALKDKQRRQSYHQHNANTGRGEWKKAA